MRRTSLFPTVILSAFLTSCALAQAPPGAAVPLANVNLDEARLRVHFIDIGPGMAALIEAPSGVHVFVDGRQFATQSYTSRVSRGIAADVLVCGTYVDLAITDEADDKFRWFLGDGAGGFGMNETEYTTGNCPFGIALGSLNFGRGPDVVVANSEHDPNGDITVWMSRGNGTFDGPYYFLVEINPPKAPKTCQVLIGDFDLDSMNDVVTSNVFADNISVLINALDIAGL